ncbi:MAG: translation initiation factor [Bacteroidales bacterium]
MENDWKKRLGVVYSTNPDFTFEQEGTESAETLPVARQNLVVSRDRKNRKGKTATLVEGFAGSEEDLKELGKVLKSKCGTGGTARDGIVLIQGDFKDQVTDILRTLGYKVKQKGG